MPDTVAVSGGAPVEFDPWKRHRVVEKEIRRDDFWERMGDAYISMLAAGIAVAYGAGIAHAFSASLRVGAEGGWLARESVLFPVNPQRPRWFCWDCLPACR